MLQHEDDVEDHREEAEPEFDRVAAHLCRQARAV
jgi:hypothetical protein